MVTHKVSGIRYCGGVAKEVVTSARSAWGLLPPEYFPDREGRMAT
jgi:hypothetical protein